MNAWFPRITVHSLAILVSVLTYVLTTRVERERRPPSIAIAWVLGLIALPYATLPAYLLFGRRKLPRSRVASAQPPQPCHHWAQTLIESFGLAPAANARIQMHPDGRAAARSLFDIMASARDRLDICTYILGKDDFGREATDRMIECARAGVRVRLLLDGVGAIQLPRAWLVRLNDAGVRTAIFSPLLARRTQGPRNLRNHRKWVIADGTRLWAGGRNLAAEYFTGSATKPAWRDLTFDLEGPVAAAAASQFDSDWAAAGGKHHRRRRARKYTAGGEPRDAAEAPLPIHPSTTRFGGGESQFLPSGPDQPEDTVHALLIDACFRAEQRILAVTPYFVPDAMLESALRLAARRGVKIDLFIPRVSNHRLADFVRSRSLRPLATAGVSIHLLAEMNHAKAAVFDTTLAWCGSPNLDSRSLLLNYESAVVFYGADEINWLARWMEDLMTESRPFVNRAPGFWRDIAEGLLLTVAYQL